MNKSVIITGASGFIGRYLTAELLERDYDVYIIMRDAHKADMWAGYHNSHVIACELHALRAEMFPKQKYDAFIHLAWGGVNREEIDDVDIHKNNYENSVYCLKAAYELDCQIFADTGSRAEYGNINGVCEESIAGNPNNAYGKMKLEFYHYTREFCQKCSMEYLHFRLFSVIGVGDHPWSLISTACSNFVAGTPMKMGACRQLWNFMSVHDAVSAMLQCIEEYHKLPRDDNRIINIASADTRILRDFIYEIHKWAHSDSELIFDESMSGYDSNPSIHKLSAYIGWKDQIGFENEIMNILGSIEKKGSDIKNGRMV